MRIRLAHRLARPLLGLLAMACVVVAHPVSAQVASVKDPWVRSTVARQKATSAYMEITAARAARLLEASSPVAGIVEIHEMRMEKDVMRMRAIASLDLPAGQPVPLQPGGHHIMLMDLKVQVKDGDKVPITLVFELRNGSRETAEITAIARSPQAASSHGGGHGKSHSH
jgi:copper(I)-binding protein